MKMLLKVVSVVVLLSVFSLPTLASDDVKRLSQKDVLGIGVGCVELAKKKGLILPDMSLNPDFQLNSAGLIIAIGSTDDEIQCLSNVWYAFL